MSRKKDLPRWERFLAGVGDDLLIGLAEAVEHREREKRNLTSQSDGRTGIPEREIRKDVTKSDIY